ncbi:zinc finger protein 595 [Drosophila santomea]|uniref:zinc finger protein 595 n=1 Tax=Drosophila santomea TaxID=129105 RepID=UPI00195374BE|nr:zinc finger protein 595 [Drosophila santomea]XP_039494680.1 zinc finger protein 595 [Drosophila santomea]XP_039494681.1 zinc finger protein 595 [Drosophila santomea]XP_039494683.1 zinc finger protein 595 [Drosophila santomea]
MEMASRCQLCDSCFCHLSPTSIFSLGVLAKIKDLTGLWLEQEDHQPRHICPSCLNDLNTSIKLKRRIQRIHNGAVLKRESEGDQYIKSTVSDVATEGDFCDFVFEEYLEPKEEELSDSENYHIRQNQIISEQEAEECDSYFHLNNEDEEKRPHIFNDPESPHVKHQNSFIETSTKGIRHYSNVFASKLAKRNGPKKIDTQSPDLGKFIQIGTKMCLPKTDARINVVRPPIFVPEDGAAETIVPAKRGTRKMQSLECPECRRVFKTAYNLKIHLVRHTGQRDFQCTFCERQFVSKYLWRLHERVRHMGEQPFRCKFCPDTFFTSSAKSRHERTRHIRDRSYQCDECSKRFNTKTCLNKHKFLHTGLKPFGCDICHIDFARKSKLRNHFNSLAHQKKATAILDSKQCLSAEELEVALNSVLEDAK